MHGLEPIPLRGHKKAAPGQCKKLTTPTPECDATCADKPRNRPCQQYRKNTNPESVPVDGGLAFLALAGLFFAAYRLS